MKPCLQVEKMRTTFGSNVKFVMMNSFSTSDDTKAHLATTHPALVATDGWELLQNKSPKVDAETMDPVTYSENPSMEWCALCHLRTSLPNVPTSSTANTTPADGCRVNFIQLCIYATVFVTWCPSATFSFSHGFSGRQGSYVHRL